MNNSDLRVGVNDIRFYKKIPGRVHKPIFEHIGVMDKFVQLFDFVSILQNLLNLFFVKPFIENLFEAVICINQNLTREELNARVRN